MDQVKPTVNEQVQEPEFLLPGDIYKWVEPKIRLIFEISRKEDTEVSAKEGAFVDSVADETLRILIQLAKEGRFTGLDPSLEPKIDESLKALGVSTSHLPGFIKAEEGKTEDALDKLERYWLSLMKFNAEYTKQDERNIQRANLEDSATAALNMLVLVTGQKGVDNKGYIKEKLGRVDNAYNRVAPKSAGSVALAGSGING